MNLYTNGTDTYVAESAEDALTLHRAIYGPPDLDEKGEDELHVIPADKVIKIYDEETDRHDEKTAAQWAADEGRGFLCTTER